jgi:hypothetical protein
MYLYLFWCWSLACTLLTYIACRHCPFSMGQMPTRTCNFKGTSSTPLKYKYNHGGRPRYELVSSCRRAPCRWSRAGAASSTSYLVVAPLAAAKPMRALSRLSSAPNRMFQWRRQDMATQWHLLHVLVLYSMLVTRTQYNIA